MRPKTVLASAALLVTSSLVAVSNAQAQEGLRQLGTHVHGQAQLTLAVDRESGELLAQLVSPAWNIYGFEETTPTEEELAELRRVDRLLNAPAILNLPNGAACAAMGVEFDGVTALYHGAENAHSHDHGHDHDHDHGHDHDHDHDHDDHDHHDDHGHHDDHDHHDHDDHDHGDSGHDHGGHSDVTVSWRYLCTLPELVEEFDASGLFRDLPRLERLQADFFDGETASSGELTREQPVLSFD